MAEEAARESRIHFSQGDYRRGLGWGFWRTPTGCGDLGGYLRAVDLIGKVANLGDKGGGVWDRVTVTGFDERGGILTLERGVHEPLGGDISVISEPVKMSLHEIARGYVHA